MFLGMLLVVLSRVSFRFLTSRFTGRFSWFLTTRLSWFLRTLSGLSFGRTFLTTGFTRRLTTLLTSGFTGRFSTWFLVRFLVGLSHLLDRFEGTSSLLQGSFQGHSSLGLSTMLLHGLFKGSSKLGYSFLCASQRAFGHMWTFSHFILNINKEKYFFFY